ncbi:MAG: hypothetical protein HY827_01745 [Actinobacteria bacterium]|nr:hypothetical protein [Actinomycetota bacterium]
MAKKSNRSSRGKRDRAKGNAAERAAARSGSPARRATPQREGLPEEAAKLVGLIAPTFADRGDPLEVEAAASKVMLPIAAESGSADNYALGREIIRQLGERRDAAALAALIAMQSVAPAGLETTLTDAVEKLKKRDLEMPAWAAHVGEGMKPVTAAKIEPVWWDDFTIIVIEFTHVGAESTHSLLMVVDNNIGGVPVEMAIGPSLDQVVTEMTKPPTGDVPASPYESTEIGLDEAAARMRDGFSRFLTPEDLTVEDFEAYAPMAEIFRLFDSRVARIDANPDFKVHEELGDLEQSVLLDEFYSSEHAADELRDLPWLEGVLGLVVDFTTTSGGSALRWSPDLLTVLIEHVLAEPKLVDPDQAENVPVVLKHFTRFMAGRAGLPAEALDQCLDTIDELTPELIAGICSPVGEPQPQS